MRLDKEPKAPQPGEAGFALEDQRKVLFGTLVTIGGGVAFALYQGSDFFLEGIFGLTAFGRYVVVLSLVEFLGHLLLAGFLDAVTVFVSRALHAARDTSSPGQEHPALDRVLATCVLVPFVAALVLALGLSLGAPWVYRAMWSGHDPAIQELLQVAVWALPPMVLMQIPVEALKAQLNVHASVFVTQILFPYGVLGLAMLLHLGVGMGIEAMAYALVGSALCCVPISMYLCSRVIGLGSVLGALFTQGPDREVLAFAVPQSLNMAFNLGMVRIDALVLSVMPGVSTAAIGLYGLAVRATQLVRLLKLAFSGMFGPLAAKYHATGNREGLKQALHSFTRLSFVLTLPAWMIVMALFPNYALGHLSQLKLQGLGFVWVLTIVPVLGGMIGFAGNLLLMTGHAKILLLNSSLASLLNLGLNLWLIPSWGLLGAAWATAISGSAMAVAQMQEMRWMEGYRFAGYLYKKPILASLPGLLLIGALYWPERQAWWPAMPSGIWFDLGVLGLALAMYLLLLLMLPGPSLRSGPVWEKLSAWWSARKARKSH